MTLNYDGVAQVDTICLCKEQKYKVNNLCKISENKSYTFTRITKGQDFYK